MEFKMYMAKIYAKEGKTQREIAEILGVTERTVRNYLNRKTAKRKQRTSLLDPFKPTINSILDEDPYYNANVMLDKLKASGYQGQISILRDYMKNVRNQILTQAVIRFETNPGCQAQVDWLELGLVRVGERLRKRYAFVMVLGYSRKAFVCFTESMKQSVLHAAHVAAFEYFGGVPEQILYDNMKTAFVYDHSRNKYQPNKELVKLAAHYGFTPKRCRVRRPQTKGKVERFIRYIRSSFIQRYPDLSLPLDEMNKNAMTWLELVDTKKMSDFKQTRNERFEVELPFLRNLPEIPFDTREVHELVVHRDSTICFETNKYSIPPEYIRQFVTLKADTRNRRAAVYAGEILIREIELAQAGSNETVMFSEDEIAIKQLWEQQLQKKAKRESQIRQKKARKKQATEVETRNPSWFEKYVFAGAPA